MIIAIENKAATLVLTDDRRTPVQALKSVEAQRRVDYLTASITIPKEGTWFFEVDNTVYLRYSQEVFQLLYTELGYGSQSDLVLDLNNFLNDRTGTVESNATVEVATVFDPTKDILNNIYLELKKIYDKLDLIAD